MDIGGSLLLDVEFSAPSEPPTNDTCDAPLDVSAGGSFSGNFVDVADDTRLSCGSSSAGDLFYQFTTAETQDVTLEARSLTGEQMYLEVRSTCDGSDPMTMESRSCPDDAPVATRLRSLPISTYFIAVESSRREVDFTLNVAFGAPGRTCRGRAAALAATCGTDKHHRRMTCQPARQRDLVYGSR